MQRTYKFWNSKKDSHGKRENFIDEITGDFVTLRKSDYTTHYQVTNDQGVFDLIIYSRDGSGKITKVPVGVTERLEQALIRNKDLANKLREMEEKFIQANKEKWELYHESNKLKDRLSKMLRAEERERQMKLKELGEKEAQQI